MRIAYGLSFIWVIIFLSFVKTDGRSLDGSVTNISPPVMCLAIDSLITDRVLCSGELVDTLAVTTTQLPSDSIAFVYFKTQIPASSPQIIYDFGTGLDTLPVDAGNDTVRAFNLPFPEVGDGTPDIYYVYAIAHPPPTNPNCRPFDEIRVIINPNPSFTLRDQIICAGDSTQLEASGGTQYNWSPASGLSANDIPDPMASPDSSTTYFVKVTNSYSCTLVDSLEVTVKPLPEFVAIGNATSSCGGMDGSIHFSFSNVPDSTYSIYYSSGSFDSVIVTNGSASVSGLSAGNYNDLIITAEGCISTQNPDISIIDTCIDLELSMVVNDSFVKVGNEVIITMTLLNKGPSDATGVSVLDSLPPGLTYLSHTGNGSYDSVTGIWSVGILNNFNFAVLNITTIANKVGNFENISQVISANEDDIDSNPANGLATEDDQDNQLIFIDCSIIKAPITIIRNKN